MSKDKRYFETRDFKRLQREWYSKLEDGGFKDIEGGTEGHLLQGSAGSTSLNVIAYRKQAHQGLRGRSTGPGFRGFAEVADDENELINYPEGMKARYFHHAELLASQAYREGRCSDERCYTWSLHAQGLGERDIADLLERPRSQIRKHIKVLKLNILERLDNEY